MIDISVIIPTYNERHNIVPLVNEILSIPLNINVIIVDDNSPDKTGQIAKNHFEGNESVKVFIRKEKRGRGLAGIFGYRKALESGAGIIGEMDGDFSHHPRFIPNMISALENADAVIGSRYLEQGGEERKSETRKLVTKCAQFYLKLFLRIDLRDPTSGFRFFKRDMLGKIIDLLKAEDPFIVTEVIFRLKQKKAKIVEVPIIFYERRTGESKLKPGTLFKYLFKVAILSTK